MPSFSVIKTAVIPLLIRSKTFIHFLFHSELKTSLSALLALCTPLVPVSYAVVTVQETLIPHYPKPLPGFICLHIVAFPF